MSITSVEQLRINGEIPDKLMVKVKLRDLGLRPKDAVAAGKRNRDVPPTPDEG